MYYAIHQHRFYRLERIHVIKASVVAALLVLAIAFPAFGPPSADQPAA